MDKLIIGIGGVARSGKDTICNLLIRKLFLKSISSQRRALADELKLAVREDILKRHGIDVLDCSPSEKEQIRPELVEFGRVKRIASEGTHWTAILDEKMIEDTAEVIIVPDIRYGEYPNDEVAWVRNIHKGLLIHVARYETLDGGLKKWVLPPNSEEAKNDPVVRAAADFSLSWPTKSPRELEQDFGGFIETICRVVEYELAQIRRLNAG